MRPHFRRVAAYRYNTVSIRVRVVDPAFAGRSHRRCVGRLEPYLEAIPPETRCDIVCPYFFTPEELNSKQASIRTQMRILDFEQPPRYEA